MPTSVPSVRGAPFRSRRRTPPGRAPATARPAPSDSPSSTVLPAEALSAQVASPAAARVESFEPVRLGPADVPNPFAPGREIAFARARGGALEPAGLRDGDHVALLRRDTADHGDLAAIIGADGRAALWRVHPEAEGWRLSTGHVQGSRWVGAAPRVHGVVVGVLRRFR